MDENLVGDNGSDVASSIAGDDGAARRPVAPARQAVSRGLPRAYIIGADPEERRGKGVNLANLAPAVTHRPQYQALGGCCIVGLVLAYSWSFADETFGNDDGPTNFMRRRACMQVNAPIFFGFIENPVLATAALRMPVRLAGQRASAEHVLPRIMQAHADIFALGSVASQGVFSVSAILSQWGEEHRRLLTPSVQWFCPQFACVLIGGLWPLLHVVAVTRRVNRKRLLIAAEPSSKRIKRFIQSSVPTVLPDSVPRQPGHCTPTHPFYAACHSAKRIVAWLEASQYLKNHKNTYAAATAFAEIFQLDGAARAQALTRRLRPVCREVLRASRVRLDVVAMKLERKRVDAIDLADFSNHNLYVFCDASPQWRGTEMFAATVDWFDSWAMRRRLLPLVSLARHQLTALDKAFALVWQLWLMYGPTYAKLARVLQRVRSVTTDQGAERLIADTGSILPDFFRNLDPRVKVPPHEGEYLFGLALGVPGWKHMIDLFLKRTLSSLVWFPKWIGQLKAIVALFRSSANLEVLQQNLRQRRLQALADMMGSLRLANFATWRWNTLHTICVALDKVVDSLMQSFDGSCFGKLRDTASLAKVCQAMASKQWRRQFTFTRIICDALGNLMQWGCGCSCHEELLLQGESIVCDQKGRRLHQAHPHAMRVLGDLLATANQWSVDFFDGDVVLWQSAQGAVRALHALAVRKLDYLDKVPFLLSRLDEPNIKEKCLRQWESCSITQHHRVTRHFLEPGHRSGLREKVDRCIAADGSINDFELRKEVRALQSIPIDDSIAEGPHAAASRVKRAAPSADFPWIASTMRLTQNLKDVKEHTTDELQREWLSYKTILQVRAHKLAMPVRMKKNLFRAYIFRLNAHPHYDRYRNDQENPGAPDHGDFPGEEPTPVGDCEEHNEEGKSGNGSTEVLRLLREYLSQALDVYCYFTMTVAVDDEIELRCFQLLAWGGRDIVVRSLGGASAVEENMLHVHVQPLELWPGNVCVNGMLPAAVEAFPVEDPYTMDFMALLPRHIDSRSDIRTWTPGRSDVEGCIALTNPEIPRPRLLLNDPKLCVLSLVDELESRGWHKGPALVIHVPGGPRIFDGRCLASKKMYLRCVLSLDTIFQAGIDAVRSDRPQAWYALLLRSPKDCNEHLSARACKHLLQERPDISLLTDNRLACAPRVHSGAGDEVGSIAGDDGVLPVAAAVSEHELECDDTRAADVSEHADDGAPVAASVKESTDNEGDFSSDSTTSSSSSDSSSVKGDCHIATDAHGHALDTVGEHAAFVVPANILGHAVRQEHRVGRYHRLRVSCDNPTHENCAKSRSIKLLTNELGPRAAEAYLGCWLLDSHMPVGRHRRHQPTLADMRSYLATY